MAVEKFTIKVNGIYEWGTGMTNENHKVWHDYFRNDNFIYWRYTENDNGTGYLVNINCGGMIHPMDGITVLYEKTDYMEHSINELRKRFNDLARIFGTDCSEKTEVIS